MGVLPAMILSILFSLIMAYAATIHFRKGNLSSVAYALWLVIWIAFIVTAATAPLWPRLLERFPIVMRLTDFIIQMMLVVLLISSFRNTVHVTKLERRLSRLTEDLAIKNGIESGQLPPANASSLPGAKE
ncbi:MAG: DUF2304 domain-containing protein [Planctomycetota bacterium]|nr:MAG: DUF2304 domain-containing protein [Planctomycetota bacterium]